MLNTMVRGLGYAPRSTRRSAESLLSVETSGSKPLYFFQMWRFSALRFSVMSRMNFERLLRSNPP